MAVSHAVNGAVEWRNCREKSLKIDKQNLVSPKVLRRLQLWKSWFRFQLFL